MTGWEFLIPVSKPLTATIFDHLPDCIFVIDEPTSIEHSLAGLYEHIDNSYRSAIDSGEIGLPPAELFLTPEQLRSKLETTKSD